MELISTVDQTTIIEEVDTFLFSMPVEYALGHCVAQDMRMSAGIALYFKSIFGRVGELMDQRPNVGDVAYLQQNNRFIYYLITKVYSNGKPTYHSLTNAITKLRDLTVKHKVKKLAIPRIGCGLDQLNWPKVKDIIKCIFKDVECMIKVCHFTQNSLQETGIIHIEHPTILKTRKNIKDIEKREYEKLNIILYSQRTSSPYWDKHFQSVNERYFFKSQYYKDYEMDLEVGQCLHYETIEAHIYVIITNEKTADHFSYGNLENGLIKIRNMVENKQFHPTFVTHKIINPRFENIFNRKINSLICSTFLKLTPCIVIEIEN